MALTPEQIDAEAFARWGEMKGAPLAMCRGFARAIEAEVRKEYIQLIRQLVEALEDFDDAGPPGEGWKSAPLLSLLASARARLEHSTQACK